MEATSQTHSSNNSHKPRSRPTRSTNRTKNVCYQYLQILLAEATLEEKNNALYNLHNYVKQNKSVRMQSLLADFSAAFKAEYQKFPKDSNPTVPLLGCILESYQEARYQAYSNMLQNLFIKIIPRLQVAFPDDFDKDVQKIALDSWTFIDGSNLETFLSLFKITQLINPQDMVPKIEKLLRSKNQVRAAAEYIGVLGLHDSFDTKDIITRLSQDRDSGSALVRFVENKPELQKLAVQKCVDNRNAKAGGEIVKKYDLNPHDFPGLIPALQKSAVRFHLNEATWIQIEEKFRDDKDLLGFIVDEFLYKKKTDEALSIVKRHNLLDGNHLIPQVKAKVAPYFKNPPSATFNYLENGIFANDGYAPTQELMGLDAPNTYVHLKELGCDPEKDLIYIDDVESEAFDLAVKDILNSKAIGFDTEFKFNLTRFDTHGTALMQIATPDKAYIIDSLKVSETPKYNKFVKDLVTNPHIQIVGHTLSADLSKLRQTGDNDKTLEIAGELDISKLYRTLFPEKSKYSLAAICEDLIGKPMSKYEQISNWHYRPLRKAQLHYAAMDVVICLKLLEKFEEIVKSKGQTIQEVLDTHHAEVALKAKKKKGEVVDEDEEDDDEEEEEVEEETETKNEKNDSHHKEPVQKVSKKEEEKPSLKDIKEKYAKKEKSSTTASEKSVSKSNSVISSNGKAALSDLLDTLICNPDSKDILSQVNDYVKQYRPLFEEFDAELIKNVHKEHEKLKGTVVNPLSTLINRILTTYYLAKTGDFHSMIVSVFIKLPQKLKLAYPDSFDKDVQQVAITHWKNIDHQNLGTFLHTFEIRNKIDPKEKIPEIKNLLAESRKTPVAANYIATLGLYDQFDIDKIIETLAADRESLATLTHFVRNFPELQKKSIEYCLENKNFKNASELVTNFKFNPHDFPRLITDLQKSALRFHMGEGTWIQLEERFYETKDILGLVIDEFFKKGWVDEALSIVKRHNMLDGDYLTASTKEQVKPYFAVPPTKTFTYMENELFTKDDYAPTHEVLGLDAPKTFLHLSDLGIDVNKDLIFIDETESEAFDLAVRDILNSKAIGFDTEFKFTLTKFDVHGTGLMQIATATKAYLIDSMKISNTPKHNQFVKDLISNPNIQIVGHTLSADISKLRETQKKNDQEEKGGLTMAGEMDISKIYRLLYPGKKYALASICEDILKKPMSKYDQMSNWHNRPLRKAQMHYAALDAVVVLVLFEKLRDEIHSRGADVEEFIRLKGNAKPAQSKSTRNGRYSKKTTKGNDTAVEEKKGSKERKERPKARRNSKNDQGEGEKKVEKVKRQTSKKEGSKDAEPKKRNSGTHYETQYVAKEKTGN